MSITKRFFISFIVGLVSLISLIFIQISVVNNSLKQEQQILTTIDALLFETRTLLINLDQNIHPLEKYAYVSQANASLENYEFPPIGKQIPNVIGLESVAQANRRRSTLQFAREQIPELLKDTQALLIELDKIYTTLENYLEYEPTYDLFERSIGQNQAEFEDHLIKARSGIKKTVGETNQLQLEAGIKQAIIDSIAQPQEILSELISVTQVGDKAASDRLRAEFIETMNNSRVEIDQIIVNIGHRKQLIEDSLQLSKQIKTTLEKK